MRVFAYRADRHGKLARTFGALVKAVADFLLRVCRDLVNAILLRIATVRALRTVWPSELFEVLPRRFFGRELRHDLNEGQVAAGIAAARGLAFLSHALNLGLDVGFVKCIIA